MLWCRHIGKREADAEALHGSTSTTLYNTRISKPVKKVRNAKKRCSPFTKQVGHPDCVSEPVKQCENIPNSNKRNVARTVCDTVVDTHEVEVSFKKRNVARIVYDTFVDAHEVEVDFKIKPTSSPASKLR